MFDAFAAAGGNFIDTANNYQGGVSEEIVGELVAGDRDRWVIASKYTLNMVPGDPNAWGNHRKNMARSIEASLKRLGTDHVDLYWVHIWDFTTPIEEVMRGLEDLTRAGKVLHVGASDTPAWVVSRANAIAELRGWNPFSAIQIEWSLLQRSVEHDLVPMANALGLGIAAWSPLAGGLLTGKHREASADSGRAEWVAGRAAEERTRRVVDAVLAVAAEAGRSPAQVAINWVRQQSPSVFPILGARKPEQLADTLGALEFELSKDQLAKLSEASAIPGSFLAGMWSNQMLVDNFITGGTLSSIDGITRHL
jgi:aryl-alcohol dehydrogenase-like predicted oxidoreductase